MLQLVTRPDVVEMHDVTAQDPKLLVHLKVCVTYITVSAVPLGKIPAEHTLPVQNNPTALVDL